MKKTLASALLALLFLSVFAYSQTPTRPAIVITTCGSQSLTTGAFASIYVDSNGVLCVGITGAVTIDTSGLATSTLQTTGNTSLSTIAGAVSGSEMQVDIVSGSVGITGTVTINTS